MLKKRTISAVLAILVTLSFGVKAFGDDYPSKPVQLLIPFGAGGSADAMGTTDRQGC